MGRGLTVLPLTLTAGDSIRAGQWHHVAARMWSSDTIGLDVELVVDGVPAGAAYHPSAVYRVGDRRLVAGAGMLPAGGLAQPMGRVGGAGGVGAAADSGRVRGIAGGRDGWAGDDTVTRFNRVLAVFGYDGVAGGAGLSNMCPSAADGLSVAAVLSDVATLNGRPWWVDVAGRPRFAPRSDILGACGVGGGRRGPARRRFGFRFVRFGAAYGGAGAASGRAGGGQACGR